MFRLAAKDFDPHATGCTCNGCDPLRPSLWVIHAAMLETDPDAAKLVMKEDGEDPENDPFLLEETALAALLALAMSRAARRAQPVIDRMFTPPVTEGGILRGLDELAPIFDNAVDAATEAEIRIIVGRTLFNGAQDSDLSSGGTRPDVPASLSDPDFPGARVTALAGTVLEGAPSAIRIMEGVVAASKYYTNQFFNTYVIPEIQQRVRLLIDGTPFNEVPDLTDLRAILDRRLRSVPYWKLVANAAASRGYHYGYLKAAALRGVTGYRFVAVLDSRTSDVCRYMNGRVFNVAKAVSLMERVAGAENIEQVKTEMPWRPFKDIDGLDTEALQELGVMVPPLHGNCRSTLVIV